MIYFDNAATSYPKPPEAIKAAANAFKIYGGNPGRGGYKMSMNTAEMIYNTRSIAADMFGASAENIVFTQNCTHALNLAIKGIISQGDHVIISNLEHNSVLRPVHALSLSGRATYSIAVVDPKNPKKTASMFEKMLRKNTRAIICTHASNVTGDIVPIEILSEITRYYKINLIVDAAQTAGILPIDIEKMGIDILCCAGHKSLYGPPGTGMMILGKNDIHLNPLIEGGTGSNSIEFEQPHFSPDRFEAGTLNTVGIHGLGESMKFINKIGLDKIYKHEFGLVKECFNHLKTINKVVLYDDEYIMGEKVPVLPFNIEGVHSNDTATSLDKMNISVRAGLQCAPLAHQTLGTIENGVTRFSPGIFSSSREVEYFISCMKKIVSKS